MDLTTDVTTCSSVTLKSWLIDQDTMDKVEKLESLTTECLGDMTSRKPAFFDTALDKVFEYIAQERPEKEKDVVEEDHALVPDDVYDDLEFFTSYRDSTSQSHDAYTLSTVFQAVDKAKLGGARRLTSQLLRQPVCSHKRLQQRHAALAKLQIKYESNASTEELLTEMAALERDVLWMYRPTDAEIEALHEIAYFRAWFMSGLNGSGACLTCFNFYKIFLSPLIGILSPIVYFIIPYVILRLRFNIRIPFTAYVTILWRSFVSPSASLPMPGAGRSGTAAWMKYVSCGFSLLFYFQSLFTSFEISATLRKICGMMVHKMQRVQSFFSKAQTLLQLYWDDDDMSAWFKIPPLSKYRVAATSIDVAMIAEPAAVGGDGNSSSPNFHLFSNFGRYLKAFREFDPVAHSLILCRMYSLDCLLSILRLRKCPGFCVAEFASSRYGLGSTQRPHLTVQGGWHPCISFEANVKNDYELGGSCPPGMMLTGPNAGGKSTLLKSMMVSVILSQTLLTAPAAAVNLTPFAFLNSHVNVPDCKGRASLFEAEMLRAKKNLDTLQRLQTLNQNDNTNNTNNTNNQQRVAFIIMDEIFSSTNPVEGIAGGYAVAKNIAATDTCVCAISTHFTYLCKLAKRTGLYSNWQMPVKSTVDIVYPYKLRKGVCRQYIALELLKRSHFHHEIINDALSVKAEMTQQDNKSTKELTKTTKGLTKTQGATHGATTADTTISQ
jgi:MutS domain V